MIGMQTEFAIVILLILFGFGIILYFLNIKLKELREQEKPLLDKYQQSKSEMDQLRKELEEKLTRVNELAKLLHEEEEKDYNSKVRERTAEVKEKLRKGKKLTTEDILAFQAMKE